MREVREREKENFARKTKYDVLLHGPLTLILRIKESETLPIT